MAARLAIASIMDAVWNGLLDTDRENLLQLLGNNAIAGGVGTVG